MLDEQPGSKPPPQAGQFETLACARPRGTLVQVFEYLGHNKKWWLAPIIVFLLFVGVLIALGGSAVAPFIYTLF